MFQGTSKYLSSPVANVVFSTSVDLPMVTICNKLKLGPLPGNLTRRDLMAGKFYPDDSRLNMDVDEAVGRAFQEFNYFLNLTGKYCLLGVIHLI